MQKFKKISRIILNTLLIIVLVILIALVVGNISLNIQKRKGESTPNILGFAPISVADNNLSPEVKEGDLLIIRMTSDLQAGDVITYLFTNKKDCKTQRIVQVVYSENGQYVSQYIVENSAGEKSVVLPIYVYGKVVANFSGFAPVIAFFNTVPGTSLLIVISLLIIFMPDIVVLFKRDRRKGQTEHASSESVDYQNSEQVISVKTENQNNNNENENNNN